MNNELFEICSERDPEPADQRRRILLALKRDTDIHATDKNGVTALHHAVRFRSAAAVKTLIERGANVNQACRRNGSTPLHRAVTQTGAPGTAGRQATALEIIRLLLAAGADPGSTNKSGKMPADYVRDPTIKSLLKKRSQRGITMPCRKRRPRAAIALGRPRGRRR
jgi:tankyrase